MGRLPLLFANVVPTGIETLISLPETAQIHVSTELVAALFSGATVLPPYGERALRDISLQQEVREQIRRTASEGFDWLIEQVRRRLFEPPYYALISGMRFDEANLLFLAITGTFGELIEPSDQPGARLVMPILPATDRQEDDNGALNEGLHTDSTDWVEPNDLTCLLCVQPDQYGHGQTHLLDLNCLLQEMDHGSGSKHLRVLQDEPVPWSITDDPVRSIAWLPIFEADGIRYMKYTIALALKEGAIVLPSVISEALDFLQQTIEDAQNKIGLLMQANDLLLVNNKMCLHARTQIPYPESSQRIVLRTKVRKFKETR